MTAWQGDEEEARSWLGSDYSIDPDVALPDLVTLIKRAKTAALEEAIAEACHHCRAGCPLDPTQHGYYHRLDVGVQSWEPCDAHWLRERILHLTQEDKE